MKKQVLVIHGAATFLTYEDFLQFLRTTGEVNPAYNKAKRWKSSLPEALGDAYEVIAPSMPNKQNAKYEEWKIWFERHIPYLTDGVLLVGHSMGGIFLAKYLSENTFARKVGGTFLVAAPYDSVEKEPLGDFALSQPLDSFAAQGGPIHLYHSADDPIVDFAELAKYQKALPSAKVTTFTDRGHFDQETFPEIVADIKALA